ncbi:GNAT family N-acetyltransferase [Streptococcus himalayensis]|uniref:N-acetyltransferase domain-containing protein n=1 Tax=Streptococcus himalayensis TaxID=1888195 RepID=A0A917EER0_9STRE|nr:GNAT family N-acetyltransferase [Streptococcus himalayensis]GGE30041.1 hypothetical protein GCM10011510_09170 [Streptococcus himalayensis]
MSNKPWTIQEVADWEEIKRLYSLIFAETALLDADIAGKLGFLFNLNGEHVAFLFGQVSDNHFRLECLGVLPRYQRQGIGTLCLAALKEQALDRNWDGIWLHPRGQEQYFAMNGFEEQMDEKTFQVTMVWHHPLRRHDED